MARGHPGRVEGQTEESDGRPPAPAPKRRLALKILVPLGTILILLVIAELGLRVRRSSLLNKERGELMVRNPELSEAVRTVRRSSDPGLIYELTPGARSMRSGVEVVINSSGFRDDEFPAGTPSDTVRVVLVGDSVAWGWGQPMDGAFPQVLERLPVEHLRATGNSAVVYNLAVDGYATSQEIRILETRGLAFDPHVIVVSYVLNDPDVDDGGLARYFQKPSWELWEILTDAWANVGTKPEPEPDVDPADWQYDYYRYIHSRYEDEVAANFARLGQISREHEVPIIVALCPVFRFRPGVPYAWQNLHDNIESLCAKNDLLFLDLHASFGQYPSPEVSIDVWHPNKKGHEVVAQALAEFLVDGVLSESDHG
ncbi:MAG: SGNH/GDSL hydrolase family protein [Phycisphaerales bacterium]|nr:MAG: SGNH/GDSL hydrolase family protein [Phycisphaerales bacterium]